MVHGKASILQKMSGEYEDKFPQGRALYMYMMVHPGKKLNFMGNEIGQLREWDEKKEQDWMLLSYPAHDSFHRYIMRLNELYMRYDAFWRADYEESGFCWLDCNSESRCLYAVMRKGDDSCIAALFNLGDKDQKNYHIKLPEDKKAEVLLYSDWERYGGTTPEGKENINAKDGVITADLSRFSGMVIRLG